LASAICSSRNAVQRPAAHHRGVDDLTGLQRRVVPQHGDGAVGGDVLDANVGGGVDGGDASLGA
jgi:hypothetical protein